MKIDPSLPQTYGIEKAEEIEELVNEALKGCIITFQDHQRVKLRAVVLKFVVDDSIELDLLRPLRGGSV